MLGERFANWIIYSGIFMAGVSLFMLFGPAEGVKQKWNAFQSKAPTEAAQNIEPRQPVSLDADMELIED